MRKGWNPTRRNRNIGTEKSGYGNDNRLVIPDRHSDISIFWERLKNPVGIERRIKDKKITFIVEPVLKGFVHACSIDDVINVLNHVPEQDIDDIELIVLRQPKRKERILSPVWGRLAYWADIYNYSGTGIYLEAQSPSYVEKWKKSLKPESLDELNRLKSDGHKIIEEKRHFKVISTLEANRSTQLYRTLLHEIGHYVFYRIKYLEKLGDDDFNEQLDQQYENIPKKEKEAFAHKYADDLKSKLQSKGLIPFGRIIDKESMERDRLRLEWFIPA